MLSAHLPSGACADERARERHNYVLGGSGWMLERFGSDIAVLRREIVAKTGGSAKHGFLLLSCDGSKRRWQLNLPDDYLGTRGADTSILIRPYFSGLNISFRLVSASFTQFSVVVSEQTPNSGFVEYFTDLLRQGPSYVDIIYRSTTRESIFRAAVLNIENQTSSSSAVTLEAFKHICAL